MKTTGDSGNISPLLAHNYGLGVSDKFKWQSQMLSLKKKNK